MMGAASATTFQESEGGGGGEEEEETTSVTDFVRKSLLHADAPSTELSQSSASTTRIQLSFEVEKLKKATSGFLWSKKVINSPYVVVTNHDRSYEYGCTEVAQNCLNARFTQPIYIDFKKGSNEPFVTVSVYDKMSKGESGDSARKGCLLCDHLLDLGEIIEEIEKGSFGLKELLFSADDKETFSKKSIDAQSPFYMNHSILKICGQRSQRDDQSITFQFRGLGIKNVEKGFLNLTRTDPLFIIAKKHSYEGDADVADGYKEHWQAVYQSEHKDDHLNPVWKSFNISREQICDGDEHKLLQFEIWDYEENGKNRIVGKLKEPLNLEELLERKALNGNADKRRALEIVEVDSEGNQTSIPGGLVVVLQAEKMIL